jgi:hypothetical protein
VASDSCVFKNRDSPRVLKNQRFSAKWTGEEKSRRQKSEKMQTVLHDSYISTEKRQKKNRIQTHHNSIKEIQEG